MARRCTGRACRIAAGLLVICLRRALWDRTCRNAGRDRRSAVLPWAESPSGVSQSRGKFAGPTRCHCGRPADIDRARHADPAAPDADRPSWLASVLRGAGLCDALLEPSRKGRSGAGAALAIWVHISLEGAPIDGGIFPASWLALDRLGHGREGRRACSGRLQLCGRLLCSFPWHASRPAFRRRIIATPFRPRISGRSLLGSAILLPRFHWVSTKPMQRLGRWRLAAGIALHRRVALVARFAAGGAFAGLDPMVRGYWYANVSEGLPVWRQDGEAA